MSDVQRPDWHDRSRWPDPADADSSTTWGAPVTYPRSPDGAAPWSAVVEPAGAPPVIAEGPQARPGWLTRGRTEPAV